MKTQDIKFIEIQTKEWFDKTYGNSYFSARAYIDDELICVLPLQYGYGDHSVDMVNKELIKLGAVEANNCLPMWARENGIKLFSNKQENCLKRDVKQFGIE